MENNIFLGSANNGELHGEEQYLRFNHTGEVNGNGDVAWGLETMENKIEKEILFGV